jgi:hypothetical protein
MKLVIAVMWTPLTAITTYSVGLGNTLPVGSLGSWHIPESGLLALLGLTMIGVARRARARAHIARSCP